jgi:AbrB family looped-hinge helix DNA binding protein
MSRIVKMDSRGRVTLPRSLRTTLKVAVGDRLAFSQLSDGTVIVRVKNRRLSELGGLLTLPDQPSVSVEEMRR